MLFKCKRIYALQQHEKRFLVPQNSINIIFFVENDFVFDWRFEGFCVVVTHLAAAAKARWHIEVTSSGKTDCQLLEMACDIDYSNAVWATVSQFKTAVRIHLRLCIMIDWQFSIACTQRLVFEISLLSQKWKAKYFAHRTFQFELSMIFRWVLLGTETQAPHSDWSNDLLMCFRRDHLVKMLRKYIMP